MPVIIKSISSDRLSPFSISIILKLNNSHTTHLPDFWIWWPDVRVRNLANISNVQAERRLYTLVRTQACMHNPTLRMSIRAHLVVRSVYRLSFGLNFPLVLLFCFFCSFVLKLFILCPNDFYLFSALSYGAHKHLSTRFSAENLWLNCPNLPSLIQFCQHSSHFICSCAYTENVRVCV